MEGKNLQTEMELALAHEVKNFKLTNNRKQIHLLCDNQLTMAFFYVINTNLILNGYLWKKYFKKMLITNRKCILL